MRFLIQRVKNASVTINQQKTERIHQGLLVFIGISPHDTVLIADKMIHKLLSLRIFSDSQDKINLSIDDIDGELLMVSQFTLYANCRKGNRPSFELAGSPDYANELYLYIINQCKLLNHNHVGTGEFGADMQVQLVNDGPFTILLDSDDLNYKLT